MVTAEKEFHLTMGPVKSSNSRLLNSVENIIVVSCIVLLLFTDGVTSHPKGSLPCVQGEVRLNAGSQCFTVDTQGPCHDNMVIVADGEFGRCDCADIYLKEADGCIRPVLRAMKDNECYPLYSQGPCEQDEWFVLGERDVGICRKNNCKGTPIAESQGSAGSFVFRYNGKCHRTGTQAFCKQDHVALFEESSRVPKCYNSRTGSCVTEVIVATKTAIKSRQLECKAGQTPSVDGNCESITSFW